MSAQDLDITTYVLPSSAAAAQNANLGPIQANLSASYELENDASITTLSSNLHDISPNEVSGLLYVPSLSLDDPCAALSEQYVPSNVTRSTDIPITTYTAVALAPWFSINCTQSYLSAANAYSEVVRAIIFYQVNDTSTSAPPPVSNAIWTLDDGGHWKSVLNFPAYAIPGATGRTLMQQLSLYSGNVSTAPDSGYLTSVYGASGQARLYADLVINEGPSLPSLWVFLIIVLAVLLIIIGASSLFMGILQRRRRLALRRRVENGEVNLETLGIKRMKVPQGELDKMPLYTYRDDQAPTVELPMATTLEEASGVKGTEPSYEEEAKTKDFGITELAGSDEAPSLKHPEMPVSGSTPPKQQFSQPTCAICLDDFVSDTTTVRELPCHHIFHPECVDVFLRDHSSSCPVCKKSTLPEGFCPPTITNAMVRRDQLIRRLQERRIAGGNRRSITAMNFDIHQSAAGVDMNPFRNGFTSMQRRIHARSHRGAQGRRAVDQDVEASAGPSSLELSNAPTSTLPANVQSTNQRASILALQSEADPQRRRELARQRAIANLSQQDAAREQDIEQEQRRMPIWRRAIGRVFPALT